MMTAFVDSGAQTPGALGALKEGQSLAGFRAAALYLNDAGEAMGARFVHENTGFTLDLIRMQSVPQNFAWVNSWPTSDMGEPHTQEHLLLGKGNKGRTVAALEDALLVGSSAFTMQWRTAYHFNTEAGPDAYFTMLEKQLDALVHPDYTDEEIRREVANYGVVESPDGTLALEEKGTVYNEMVSSFERSWSRMSRALSQSLYGPEHPLAFVSGGLPAAIRRMKPEDIRRFHDASYHLANMGMVVSLPKAIELEDALARIGAILDRVEPGGGRSMRFMSAAGLPAAAPAPAGTISIAEYPNRNESQPSPLLMAWPATLKLSAEDRILLGLFLESFAGDASTNLYKRFVDSRTRTTDIGAQSVFAWVDSDPGNPIYVGFGDVDPAHMTSAELDKVRHAVLDELARVTTLLDDSPELTELNGRVRSRIVETRRSLAKFVNSPPRFGFRNTGAEWMEHLRGLEEIEGFAKSVTERPQLDHIEAQLGTNRNIWRELFARWGLLDRVPYVAAARPSPGLLEREAAERKDRIAAEVARIRAQFGAASDQDAIARYKASYDATTGELDTLAAAAKTARFVDNPPMTLDDELDYKLGALAGGTPLLTATFEDMTSATAGLALRLDGVRQEDLFYLSLLPELLTQSGVLINGKGLPYEDMSERLRREVLGVNAYFGASFVTGRDELVMTAAGNDIDESQRAIEWMGAMLSAPYWNDRNIGRLRDVVEQRLNALRTTMQAREEAWVNDPAQAYWRQDHPLLLATSSFLTKTHNALRLKWLLADPGNEETKARLSAYLSDLANTWGSRTPTRADWLALAKGLQGDAATIAASASDVADEATTQRVAGAGLERLGARGREIVHDIGHDLELSLAEIPDNSMAADWKHLVEEIRTNLLVDPLEALRRLDAVRQGLLKKSGVRSWIVGSRASQAALAPKLDALVGTFSGGPFVAARYPITRAIAARVRERYGLAKDPVFVGLVNPSTSSGVFLNSAPGTSYRDTSRDALLDYLSALLYGGGAGHGIFMKTWAAGLAYSNGLSNGARSGRLSYYAERVPVLPQTLRFVIDELRKAQPDSALVDYAISLAFSESRAAASFESRGEAMANDLSDGLTPEIVRGFRRAVLALRDHPELTGEVFSRMPSVLGRVLPGYGPKVAGIDDGVYLVIGPNEQIDKYEEYLKTVEGSDTKVYRLYPRDYWQ
jgi:Zn-dependent M16 (insulinase) family peptidase